MQWQNIFSGQSFIRGLFLCLKMHLGAAWQTQFTDQAGMGRISLSRLKRRCCDVCQLTWLLTMPFCWCLLFMVEILQQLIFFLRPKFNRIPLCRVIKPKMEEKTTPPSPIRSEVFRATDFDGFCRSIILLSNRSIGYWSMKRKTWKNNLNFVPPSPAWSMPLRTLAPVLQKLTPEDASEHHLSLSFTVSHLFLPSGFY